MGFFEDEDWEKPAMELLDKLDPKTKEVAFDIIDSIVYDYVSLIDDCESPIEQMLGIAIKYILRGFDKATILPQARIDCFGKKYRVDFLIAYGEYGTNNYKYFIVECDGHDFHEKTKLQAARDKQRDRNMTAAGYHVLRFTGSEIWKDTRKCACEVRETILNIVYRRQ